MVLRDLYFFLSLSFLKSTCRDKKSAKLSRQVQLSLREGSSRFQQPPTKRLWRGGSNQGGTEHDSWQRDPGRYVWNTKNIHSV